MILLGAISSANMLFETSMANTISTPSLFTVLSSVPIFGFTNDITSISKAMEIIINLRNGFEFEISGLRNLIVFVSKYLLMDFFCHLLNIKKTKKRIGIINPK